MSTARLIRRAGGAAYRQLFPTPEMAAWPHACQLARTIPRRTAGTIRMLDYELQYADLLSFYPQWHDIFVRGALEYRRFVQSTAHPRLRCQCRSCFAIARGNLSANGATGVEIVNAAVWTSVGRVTFRAEGTDSGMIDGLAGAIDGPVVDVPSLRLRDILHSERADLLKLDIEGAEDAVLADCEPVLDRVGAIVMDLHEFDPSVRQAPRVLERLTRAGFVYAVDELVPQPYPPPVAGSETPFPGKALVWSMTVRAWRP